MDWLSGRRFCIPLANGWSLLSLQIHFLRCIFIREAWSQSEAVVKRRAFQLRSVVTLCLWYNGGSGQSCCAAIQPTKARARYK